MIFQASQFHSKWFLAVHHIPRKSKFKRECDIGLQIDTSHRVQRGCKFRSLLQYLIWQLIGRSQKSWICQTGCYNVHIILKFGRCLSSNAAEVPAKFKNDCRNLRHHSLTLMPERFYYNTSYSILKWLHRRVLRTSLTVIPVTPAECLSQQSNQRWQLLMLTCLPPLSTLLIWAMKYSMQTRSISWLLKSWLLMSPGHQ